MTLLEPSALAASSESGDLRAYAARLRQQYGVNGRVLLMQTPQFLYEAYNPRVIRQRGFYAYPPRGLQCIKQSLSALPLDIHIADLNFEFLHSVIHDEQFNHDEWIRLAEAHIERVQPSIIGLSWLTVAADVDDDHYYVTWLLRHLRRQNRHIIVLGGPIATDEYQYYLKKELCHFVVTGEGENKSRLLFSHLLDHSPPMPEMQGIYYNPAGTIRESSGAVDKVVPDQNIVPTYADIRVEDYCTVGSLNPFSRMPGSNVPFGTILLNRGCRANCRFCGVTVFMGRGLRQERVSNLIDEVRHLIDAHGIRHFEILDDDFLGTPSLREGLVDLLKELVDQRRRHPITWSAGNGLIASSLDRELMALIRDSGCLGFRIGIESGNPAMLKRMRKPTSLPVLRRVAKDLVDFPEVLTCGNYILGLFGEETFEEMLDTLRLVFELQLDWASFTIFQVTNKERARQDNIATTGKAATDFVPTKATANRELQVGPGIVTGLDVLALDRALVPSPEQLNQIWFTFNLIGNYIANRNLQPGGNVAKLLNWLEAVHVSYPDNAYMPLFMALGYRIAGDETRARLSHERAAALVQNSAYWRHCFDQFELIGFIEELPESPERIQQTLMAMTERHRRSIGPGRGR